MNIVKISKFCNDLPTIMDFSDEIFLIENLKNCTVEEIRNDIKLFVDIVRKIQESHCDSGIFELNDDNEHVFIGFYAWLDELGIKLKINLHDEMDGFNLTVAQIREKFSS